MSKWKPEALLLVESPFGSYDAERFGLTAADRVMEMVVADLTPLIKPEFWRVFGKHAPTDPRVRVISTERQFRELLASRIFDVAIDEIGASASARKIRRLVIAKKLPRVRLRLGLLPGDFVIQSSLRERFIARRSQFGFLRLLRNVLLIIPRRLASRIPPPDLVLGSGSETRKEVSSEVPIIWGHSFDYEKARILDASGIARKSSGAVFLDQNLGYHPDQMHSSLRSPVSVDSYYPRLRKAFEAVEREGIPVSVALHPKASTVDPRTVFGDRPAVMGSSQTLIRDAALVLCHASASVSYAVIWRKPVLFLTSTDLERSWYHGHIHEMSRILRRPILDIDSINSISDDVLHAMINEPVDESAYANYEEKFIRSDWSPVGGLWEIFVDGLTEVLALRR